MKIKESAINNRVDYQEVLRKIRYARLPVEVKLVARTLLDKKALKITVLRLREHTDVTDHLIIAIGTGPKHNQALADELEETLRKELKLKALGVEGKEFGEWVLLDYVDFIIHIFSEEFFQKYQLEKLWMDVRKYDFLSC